MAEREKILILLAILRVGNAQCAESVAVIAAFQRNECPSSGMQQRRLQRELDSLGTAGRTK